ncbi:MAG: prepilin-type N-terminal cleavage/methylation domain-containing protein [Burkholderiaceae bacterium]|nr:prepilin-type N-terminal cleavage/methylation domain-containing protein [Burkholderiaceae bacterium]
MSQLFALSKSHQSKHSNDGFTLIELMIVAAIVAIIAAIAVPSYVQQVARSRRADAQAVLLESAQWLERFYTQNNNYDAAATFPAAGLSFSPRTNNASTAFYRIDLVLPGANSQTFTLTATRINAMASDACGNFVLNSVGQRSLVSNTRTDCWAR